MSKGKLTRQELGWLLTQEAQGAADRLKKGVSALTQAPPATQLGVEGEAGGVDATLSALDDTMRMLSSLHPRPTATRGRRGRIDVASLLWEVAPEARVSIEPGGGTEVFGEEAELRRMLHVMLGHGSGTGSTVAIRREGDEVAVRVLLGPDRSATADTERAWLSRMAMRYGGRYELEGSGEVLTLPAEGVDSRDDVAKLRKELDEARKQGEAYARELAAVWTAEEESVSVSTFPPQEATAAAQRSAVVVRLAGGVAAALRNMLAPVGRELTDLRSSMSPRRSSPDWEHVARTGIDERLDEIRRKVLVAQDFVAELATLGESEVHEPFRHADLMEIVRDELKDIQVRAARAGIDVHPTFLPEDPTARAIARIEPRAVSLLFRALMVHAISASPRGSAVHVTVQAPSAEVGARIIVDDAGTTLPAAARRALLALQVEPGTFGRPNGVGLFIASELALAEGAELQIADAPQGGMRVTVAFPRTD